MAGSWILAPGLVAGTVLAMEVLAWAVHRYVMHGRGWGWHRSHHEPGPGRLETNDLYALVFAGISLLFFTLLARLWPPFWWVGVGTLVYGLLYALLHDGLVHRRLGFDLTPRRGYLRRLVQAHRLHHAVRERDGAVSFGFLYAPPVRRLRRQLRIGTSSRRKPGPMNTDSEGSDTAMFMDPGSSPG
ncbi:MAG TPA: sterol desaturase family protein [Allosphingosinicella sp.]